MFSQWLLKKFILQNKSNNFDLPLPNRFCTGFIIVQCFFTSPQKNEHARLEKSLKTVYIYFKRKKNFFFHER